MNIRKLFTRPENYTAMDEMSPADRAKQTWDNRDGSVIIQNYNLRLLNIGQLAVNVILVGALIFSSMKSSVQPFVVFANPQNGEVWHVGTAAEAQNFEPTEEMKRYFMANFIKNTREIPLDPVVYKKNLLQAYNFMTKDAGFKYQAQLENDKVGEKLGHSTVVVDIVSIVPVESGKSYQVRWTETELTIDNGKKTVTPYSGIFSVQTMQVDDEKQLAANPIGFYILDFNYSKDATDVNNPKTANNN